MTPTNFFSNIVIHKNKELIASRQLPLPPGLDGRPDTVVYGSGSITISGRAPMQDREVLIHTSPALDGV